MDSTTTLLSVLNDIQGYYEQIQRIIDSHRPCKDKVILIEEANREIGKLCGHHLPG